MMSNAVSDSAKVQTGQKLIRKVNINAETEDLETLLGSLTAQINALEGYIENQELYNGSSYSSNRHRSANLTIRIPADKLDELGMNIPSCGACLSNMAITPDGTVVPCQSWLDADAGLGHILRDDWKAIWTHPTCQALRGMTEEQALSCPFRKREEV